MRFAGNTSNVGSWIQAGKAGAKGVADAFKVARSNAPDYGGIGEANQKARSMERQAATAAEAQVANAGLRALETTRKTEIEVDAKMKVLDKKLDAKRKAGIVGAVGAVAGGAFLGIENKKAEERQAKRDAEIDAREQGQITQLETLRTQLRELSDNRGEGPKAPRRSDFDTAGLYNDDDDGETSTSTGSETNASSDSPTGTLTLSELQKQTRDIVGKYESAGSGDYNAFNLGGKDGGHTAIGSGDSSAGQFGKPLTSMSIGEIRKLGGSGQIHATGRYQFTHNTGSFAEAVQFAGLKDTDLFTPENQDKMFFAFGQKYGPSRWVGLKNASPEEMSIVRQGFGWNK